MVTRNTDSQENHRTTDQSAAADRPDPAGNLRSQYFDCLASGKSTCTVPDRSSDLSSGSLELTNPFATPSERLEKPQPVSSDVVLPRAQWTLAFNLTTTQDHGTGDNSDARVYAGARNKTAELLELAQSTVGKPVTLVVQNAQRVEQNTPQTGTPIVDGQGHSSLKGATTNNQILIHTYLIHDGQIQELPARPSQGVAADTEALLKTAGQQAPSEHLALFAQGHGGGPHGVSGDTGRATLTQMDEAIKNGLKASGRDKLDLVDFDACSMGNAAVLAAVGDTANHIIASPEMETAGGEDIDAQNVKAIVGAVLDNPSMNGGQLGQKIIELADQGANGGANAPREIDRVVAGTDTLAHYDASEIQNFQQNLDQLGTALNQGFESQINRQAILSAIGDSPLASTAGGIRLSGTPRAELRDSKTFADNILTAVENGSISDPQGNIKGAVEALLASQSRLVQNYHGEVEGGYDQQGGLSLFLPGRTYLDNQSRADELNPAARLSELASEPKYNSFDNKESLLHSLDDKLEEMQRNGVDAAAIAGLKGARVALTEASNSIEYSTALTQLESSGQEFKQSDAGRRLNQVFLDKARELTTKAFNEEIPGGQSGGWTVFLHNLQAMAN